MAETVSFEVTLPSDLVEALDEVRGSRSRDEILEEILNKRFPRKLEEEQGPKVEYLFFGKGEARVKKEAFNLKNAALYLGTSPRGLDMIREKLENEGHPLQPYKKGYGPETFILKEDLDDLIEARPVSLS